MIHKFVTIFPGFRNFHFYKDPGQIPYRFSKKGIHSEIVCFINEESYQQTNKFIKVKTIPKTTLSKRFNLGIVWYLIKNAKKIDVLNVYHFLWSSLWFSFVYKILNKKGFVYLKMDSCYYTGTYHWELLLNKNILKPPQIHPTTLKNRGKDLIIPKLIKFVDLWSVEDEESCKYYENSYQCFKGNIITSFNGHTIDIEKNVADNEFYKKENIILSAGRFGTKQKATEILLEAFITVAQNSNWILHLAGSVEESFKSIIEIYFQKYPELIGRVIFNGSLEKKVLFDLYNRSRIFCLPSRWEGFANVFSEAMYFRNAIVTTPATSVRDIVIENQFGELVEVDNIEQLSETLLRIIKNPLLNERYANNAKEFCNNNLSWDHITEKLKTEIESKRILKNR